jgi:hypothetical protein
VGEYLSERSIDLISEAWRGRSARRLIDVAEWIRQFMPAEVFGHKLQNGRLSLEVTVNIQRDHAVSRMMPKKAITRGAQTLKYYLYKQHIMRNTSQTFFADKNFEIRQLSCVSPTAETVSK